jgi:hypothetical protein
MQTSVNKLAGMIIKYLPIFLSVLLVSCKIGNQASSDVTEWERQVNLNGQWAFSIGDDMAWANPKFNDADWEKIKAPSPWENEGFNGYNGYAWYRKHFTISSSLKNTGLYLHLGIVDDVDEVFINGNLVGTTGSFPPKYETAYYTTRNYPLPNAFLKYDQDNIICVRVYDYELEGGITQGDLGIFTLKNAMTPEINLEGLWKMTEGDSLKWKEPKFADTSWGQIIVPGYWESQGHRDYDGFAWYRKTFTAPKNLKPKKWYFLAGKIDDLDQVYINGILIGSHGDFKDPLLMSSDQTTWQQLRAYEVPDNLLQPGKENVIAIRVFDGGLGGGIYEGPIGFIKQEEFTKFWHSRRD